MINPTPYRMNERHETDDDDAMKQSMKCQHLPHTGKIQVLDDEIKKKFYCQKERKRSITSI